MMAKAKRGVLISDLHVGSRVGLSHPDYGPSKGGCQHIRDLLWKHWKECSGGAWHKPDFLVVNGEATDGQGRRSGGSEQWTTDIQEQVTCAVELVKMWDAKKVYVIRGSGYHVEVGQTGMCADELFAKEIGATKAGQRSCSAMDMTSTVGGVTFHFAHIVGFSQNFAYRGTPLNVELLHAALHGEIDDNGTKRKVQILVRGHAHYYWHSESATSHAFILPCWQGKTMFMRRRKSLAVNPHIGFVGVTVKDGEFSYERHVLELEGKYARPHVNI